MQVRLQRNLAWPAVLLALGLLLVLLVPMGSVQAHGMFSHGPAPAAFSGSAIDPEQPATEGSAQPAEDGSTGSTTGSVHSGFAGALAAADISSAFVPQTCADVARMVVTAIGGPSLAYHPPVPPPNIG